ncbi:MAG TPA: hypothetical protein PLP26_10590, partial [Ilumatobacteraceae bacterium]|nr:hypothetical protein [Ilumatobacteraceae bacterium]
KDGVERGVVLEYLEGLTDQVTPTMAPLAPGELALSRTNAGQLGVVVGDQLLTADNSVLTVAHVFDDIPFAPVPDAWCGLRNLVEPKPSGDLPPVSGLVAEATVAQFNVRTTYVSSYIEYRITTDPVTLTDISAALAAYQTADDDWRAAFSGASLEGGRTELPAVFARAKAVGVTVERSLAPVRLTSLLSVGGVLVAAAVLMARERRRDLRLLAVRGVHPVRIALGTAPSVAVVAAPAAALGFGLAWLLVTQFGPAALLETHAVVSAVVATFLCLVVGLALVVGTVAFVADRSVDRSARPESSRWLLPLAGLLSVGLTVWSFQRLDSRGGIRTFGVEARGGDLLALGFPLFALLTITALAAFVLRRAIAAARLSGAWLPRALRLGWRRVVMEAGPTVATIAAIALASGSLITATALSDGAQRQLVEKAQVYAGSDLSVAIFDDPVLAADVQSRSTLVWTARAKSEGHRVDLWGIDPATFAHAAGLRGDAASKSLAQLLALLKLPSTSGLPPAIATGGGWTIGDVVSLDVTGNASPVKVELVALADFFPGKTTGASLIAVDESVVTTQVKYSVRRLLVRDPPTDLVDTLRAGGTRVGVVLDAATTFDASNFSGLRWAYRPLALLGLLFAIMAAAVQLLVVAARRDTRRAANVVMRRTGFRTRSLWLAALVEAATPLIFGVVLGVGSALVASALAVVRLDPMPLLAPPARFVMPWDTVLTLAAVAPVWVLVTAFIIVRTTVRADPMRAMRGDQ